MTKIELQNGSTIEYFESTVNTRSNRSKVVSFYCVSCQEIHWDYPICDVMFISESFEICKESYDRILNPMLNKQI